MEEIVKIVIEFVSKYPVFASIMFIMGALRLVFKPIFEILHAYVLYTPNPADDVILAKIEKSKPVVYGLWLLDYLASVKLIK